MYIGNHFSNPVQVFNTAPKHVECELLFPQCDPVLSSLWILSHALHTDVAHVPTQVQHFIPHILIPSPDNSLVINLFAIRCKKLGIRQHKSNIKKSD